MKFENTLNLFSSFASSSLDKAFHTCLCRKHRTCQWLLSYTFKLSIRLSIALPDRLDMFPKAFSMPSNAFSLSSEDNNLLRSWVNANASPMLFSDNAFVFLVILFGDGKPFLLESAVFLKVSVHGLLLFADSVVYLFFCVKSYIISNMDVSTETEDESNGLFL